MAITIVGTSVCFYYNRLSRTYIGRDGQFHEILNNEDKFEVESCMVDSKVNINVNEY